MCGIFAYLVHNQDTTKESEQAEDEFFKTAFELIKNSGPDTSVIEKLKLNRTTNLYIGFHRLSIMDPTPNGNQPFVYEDLDKTRKVYVICNGEIYNYKNLISEHKLQSTIKSNSDCAVIGPLFMQYGLEKCVTLLEGEFAGVVVEVYENKVKVNAFRDRFGVRPLYFSTDGFLGKKRTKNFKFGFCSELKGLVPLFVSRSEHFPPSNYAIYEVGLNNGLRSRYVMPYYIQKYPKQIKIPENIHEIHGDIRRIFTEQVISMLMTDRPIGFLLSGGLDSSLVCGIAAKYYAELKEPQRIHTFSIGMKGSSDLAHAQIVAKHINSIHTEIIFTPEEGMQAYDDIIYSCESWDVTTIRASVGQYLMAKYIKEKTQIKVLLCGDGADEVCQGYFLFHLAPNSEEASKESERLVRNIYLYDVTRVDKNKRRFGLEARVPFLSHKFVDYFLSIDPNL